MGGKNSKKEEICKMQEEKQQPLKMKLLQELKSGQKLCGRKSLQVLNPGIMDSND